MKHFRRSKIAFSLILIVFVSIGCDSKMQTTQSNGQPSVTTSNNASFNTTLESQSRWERDVDVMPLPDQSKTEHPLADRTSDDEPVTPPQVPSAQQEPDEKTDRSDEEKEASRQQKKSFEIPSTWKKLGKHEIWIDFKNKQVIMGGNICLRAGQLEMFVCPTNTKEHESVIAANAQSSEMHAALVALGAEPGKPCQWDPEYKPASGPLIDIKIMWHDPETSQSVTRPAQDMIRNFHTKKTMTHQWVFGGSEFWKDPETGEEVYYANSGEMICLSNFSTATLDLNVESSQSNDNLLFEAFTENIPPLGTKVYVILTPGKRIGESRKTPPPESSKSENLNSGDSNPKK